MTLTATRGTHMTTRCTYSKEGEEEGGRSQKARGEGGVVRDEEMTGEGKEDRWEAETGSEEGRI